MLTISAHDSVTNFMDNYTVIIINRLSSKFNFDPEEAMRVLDITIKPSPELISSTNSNKSKSSNASSKGQSKIPLPFTGVMCNDFCNAIRLNHNLYTQCTNEHTLSFGEYNVCKTCAKQVEKNTNSKPNYGYIQDRIRLGDSFRDPKGKPPAKYGNVMEKLNITRSDVEKEAARLNITIDESHYDVEKRQRGRPKKDTSAIDTSSEEGDVEKRPRGRPPKDKKCVTNLDTEKPSAKKESVKNIPESKKKPEQDKNVISDLESDSDSDSDSESEELAVTEFNHDGKKYLKAADNTLYDYSTHEEIGNWNTITRTITFI